MGKHDVGDAIRETRCRLGISQEELCYGICSPGNLSKIENGTRQPNAVTFQLLMERMGEDIKAYPIYLSGKEMRQFRLKHEIEQDIYFERYAEAERKLKDFHDGIDKTDNVDRQFMIVTETVCGFRGGRISAETALCQLKDALQRTLPEFEAEKIRKIFFTDVEIHALVNIAFYCKRTGEQEKAVQLLEMLEKQLHTLWKERKRDVAQYPLVAFNFSNLLEDIGQYREAWQIAREGVQYCISEGELYYFPHLLANEGFNLAYDGQKDAGENKIQQAYHVFIACCENKKAEIIRKTAEEKLSFTI